MSRWGLRNARLLGAAVSAVALVMASLVPASPIAAASGTQTATDPTTGIVATTPATYGFAYPNCPSGAFGPDQVAFTNIQPADSLQGWIQLEQINADGSRTNLGSQINVSFTGTSGTSVSYPVNYPGFAGLPINSSGTQEFHVDLSVGVFQNGVQVATFDGASNGTNIFGPLNWDVYCGGNPPPPPPSACTISSSIKSNFNGTAIAAGDDIWFSSVMKVSGLGSKPVTISMKNATISFTANGTSYSLPVPDAQVTFSPTATQATTTFDTGTNTWVTVAPMSFAGNAFLSGLTFPVTTALPGGINPVTWSGQISSDTPGVSVNWQWAAAVYKSFGSSYGSLGVKPLDDNKLTAYQNSDHAGTPENFKSYVTGGARGGGGSNFTGSYSGTASAKCP